MPFWYWGDILRDIDYVCKPGNIHFYIPVDRWTWRLCPLEKSSKHYQQEILYIHACYIFVDIFYFFSAPDKRARVGRLQAEIGLFCSDVYSIHIFLFFIRLS